MWTSDVYRAPGWKSCVTTRLAPTVTDCCGAKFALGGNSCMDEETLPGPVNGVALNVKLRVAEPVFVTWMFAWTVPLVCGFQWNSHTQCRGPSVSGISQQDASRPNLTFGSIPKGSRNFARSVRFLAMPWMPVPGLIRIANWLILASKASASPQPHSISSDKDAFLSGILPLYVLPFFNFSGSWTVSSISVVSPGRTRWPRGLM